jgi:O-antigen ligase
LALSLSQRGLLMGIAFISVIASPRVMIYELENLPGVPLEFKAVTLSLPDFLMIAALAVTLVRLVLFVDYRARLWSTAQAVWRPHWLAAWAALVLWLAISTLWAIEPLMTRFMTLHTVAVLLLALIVVDAVRHDADQPLLIALVASGVVQAGIAVAQAINGNPLGLTAFGEIERFVYDNAVYYRAPGLSQHPNYLGGYLVVAIFAALLLAQRQRSRHGASALALLAGLFCGIGLITTLSRSAIMGLVAGSLPVLIALLRRAKPATRRLIVGATLALIVAGGGLALVATRGDLINRFFTAREFFFDWSWAEIQARPLHGAGGGNLMFAISWRGVIETYVLPVHNVYLYVWGESGLVGVALFVLGLGSLAALWAAAFTTQVARQGGRWERLLWGGVLLGLCVIMLFDNYWWAIHPFKVLWFWALGWWWGTLLRAEGLAAPDAEL